MTKSERKLSDALDTIDTRLAETNKVGGDLLDLVKYVKQLTYDIEDIADYQTSAATHIEAKLEMSKIIRKCKKIREILG